MTGPQNQQAAQDLIKSIGAVVGVMLSIFALLEIFLPTSLVQPIGALAIGLGVTVLLVWLGRSTWQTVIPIWLAVGILLLVVYLIVSRPATVVGQVIDNQGHAVAGLSVVLTDSNGVDHRGVTDGEGMFAIKGVPEGRFTVTSDGELLVSGRVPSGWVRMLTPQVDMGSFVRMPSPTPPPEPTPTFTPSPTPRPTLTPVPSKTPTPTTSPTPTPRVVDHMDEDGIWKTYGDDKGSSLNLDITTGLDGEAIEAVYNLRPNGWVGLYRPVSPVVLARLADASGLAFRFRGSGASNTIELKLMYAPDASGESAVFSIEWARVTDTSGWETKEAPFGDFTCWIETPCAEGEQIDIEKVERIDFAISNKAGGIPGNGYIIIDEIWVLE
jgi:hypothetical protein